MNKKIIEIRNISKCFEGRPILENFSLSILEGKIHGLIGPNGSGKTTLLRLISGLYLPDSGNIKKYVNHSMLLEEDYLYEEKTGYENLILFGKYFQYDLKNSMVKDFLPVLDLEGALDREVYKYSKGMKRKLSLLIVILMDKDLLLLDEPTSGVDPISRVQIRNILLELKKKNKTILITSHDLGELEKICDTVTMIKQGKILFEKDAKSWEGKNLEELFIQEGRK
ncbi:MAG: ABC transporter ATP-binding protein [Tissierellia bacterium]|nr:ABC transporter ATP-binding protein [Tissierellia bacterium]